MIPEITENAWTFQRYPTNSWIFCGCYHKKILSRPKINEINIQYTQGDGVNQVIVHVNVYSGSMYQMIFNEDRDGYFRKIIGPEKHYYTFVKVQETATELETLRTVKKALSILQRCDPSVDEVIRNFTLSLLI